MRKDKSSRKAALLSLLVVVIICSASFIYANEAGNNAAQKHVTGMTIKEKTGTSEFLKDDDGNSEDQGIPTFRVSLNDNCDAFFLIDSPHMDNVLDSRGDENYRAIFGIHLSL